MKRIIILLVIILVSFILYRLIFKPGQDQKKQEKQAPISVKKHSDGFNSAVSTVVHSYLDAKNAFVEDDTLKAKQDISRMIASLDSLPIDELKKDATGIYETAKANIIDIKANAESLLSQSNISEMRKDFSMITEMMYPSFFKSINYEGDKLYVQNCPMAFGDEVAANWISNSPEILNPYLGKKHPKYKATMLHCGEVKDSIMMQK